MSCVLQNTTVSLMTAKAILVNLENVENEENNKPELGNIEKIAGN